MKNNAPALLKFFEANPNRVVTYDELQNLLWSHCKYNTYEEKIHVYALIRKGIQSLRSWLKKTGMADAEGQLQNVRGEGYRYCLREEAIVNLPAANGTSPFSLGDGKIIQLDMLLDLIVEGHSEVRDGLQLDLWFVFGSGRDRGSKGHSGLICDGINMPEITELVATSFHRRFGSDDKIRTKVNVRSNYDIVLLPELQSGTRHVSERLDQTGAKPHVITVGMGDVNAATRELVEHWKGKGTPIVPGPVHPDGADLWVPSEKDKSGKMSHKNRGTGWLAATSNPWVPGRLAVAVAGVDGLGTMAASWALVRYLRHRQQDLPHRGNNKLNAEVAARVVVGDPATGDWLDGYESVECRPLNLHRALRWVE